jgi:integrase
VTLPLPICGTGAKRIRLLSGEKERDLWLTQDEADRLIAAAASHLQMLIRFALATGCRAREITGLEWDRVDLQRGTAWLDQTKNGTPRGVPLNRMQWKCWKLSVASIRCSALRFAVSRLRGS